LEKLQPDKTQVVEEGRGTRKKQVVLKKDDESHCNNTQLGDETNDSTNFVPVEASLFFLRTQKKDENKKKTFIL
jgi:hypothetical protein